MCLFYTLSFTVDVHTEEKKTVYTGHGTICSLQNPLEISGHTFSQERVATALFFLMQNINLQ